MANGGPTGKSLTPFERRRGVLSEELAEWFQVVLQDLEVRPLLVGKLSLQRATLSPEGLSVRQAGGACEMAGPWPAWGGRPLLLGQPQLWL